MLTSMSVVLVRFGNGGPAKFFTNRRRISVSNAFGLYRSGANLQLVQPREWKLLSGEMSRSEDTSNTGKREYTVDGVLHREDGPAIVMGRLPNKLSQNKSFRAEYRDKTKPQAASREWHLHGNPYRTTYFDTSGGFEETLYSYDARKQQQTLGTMTMTDGKVTYYIPQKKKTKKKTKEEDKKKYNQLIRRMKRYFYNSNISFPSSKKIVEASKKPIIEFA